MTFGTLSKNIIFFLLNKHKISLASYCHNNDVKLVIILSQKSSLSVNLTLVTVFINSSEFHSPTKKNMISFYPCNFHLVFEIKKCYSTRIISRMSYMWTTAFISCRAVISDISVPFETSCLKTSCLKTSLFLDCLFNPGEDVADNWAKDWGDKPEDDRLSVTSFRGEVEAGFWSTKTRQVPSVTSLRGEGCRFSNCFISFSSLAMFDLNQKTKAAANIVRDNIQVTKMNSRKRKQNLSDIGGNKTFTVEIA